MYKRQVYGTDPAVQIAEYARVSGVTKIVMGRMNHRSNSITRKKSMADRLIELTDLDVYIIPDQQPLYKKPLGKIHRKKLVFSWKDTGKMLLVLLISTLLCFTFYSAGFSESNIITVFILGVLVTAVWTNGHLYGAVSSLLSVAAFNFFFTEPKFTFQATDQMCIRDSRYSVAMPPSRWRRMRRMRLAARRQMPAQQPAADKTIVSCGPPRESPSLPCSYYTPGIQKKSTDFVTNL